MTITSEQIAEWRRRIRAFEMPAWSEEEYFILTLLDAYEQQAALLAEAREEKARWEKKADDNLESFYDMQNKFNKEHVRAINAEASESNWKAVAMKYKAALNEIYISGSPDEHFWQIALHALMGDKYP